MTDETRDKPPGTPPTTAPAEQTNPQPKGAAPVQESSPPLTAQPASTSPAPGQPPPAPTSPTDVLSPQAPVPQVPLPQAPLPQAPLPQVLAPQDNQALSRDAAPPIAVAGNLEPSASAARDLYDYGTLKSTSVITRVLWYCAGADAQLLIRCPNSDRVKFQGIGGVVLTVGILAFFSGSYAFYTIFSPKDGTALADAAVHYPSVAISIFFGFVWALIIFNIDRFIISSTGKGDGTERITWNEFTNALPRLGMALIIGLCMSKPLEIKILQSEIESHLEKEQKEYLAELNAQSEGLTATERKRLRTAIDDLQSRTDNAENALEKRRVEINQQRERLEDEAGGKLGGRAGRGPAWRDKKRNLGKQEAELKRDRANIGKKYALWNGELTEYKAELSSLDAKLSADKSSNAKVARHLDGLMKRIQISEDIGGFIPFAIMLLLLCIEAGPILFKLMVIKGAYDYLEENQKRIVRAYHGIEPDARIVADGQGKSIAVDIHHAVAAVLEEEKRRLTTEAELADEVHAAYRARLSQRIQEDPTPFIKE